MGVQLNPIKNEADIDKHGVVMALVETFEFDDDISQKDEDSKATGRGWQTRMNEVPRAAL